MVASLLPLDCLNTRSISVINLFVVYPPNCNHMHFSLFLYYLDLFFHYQDINRGDETEVEKIHYEVLSIISLVGLAVSIAALGLVILTAIMYK